MRISEPALSGLRHESHAIQTVHTRRTGDVEAGLRLHSIRRSTATGRRLMLCGIVACVFAVVLAVIVFVAVVTD
jgi:hypothetical protein